MAAIRKVLPGFQLTLGYTLFYLLLIVLIPLSALLFKTFSLTWLQFSGTRSRHRVCWPRTGSPLGLHFWRRWSTCSPVCWWRGCWCVTSFRARRWWTRWLICRLPCPRRWPVFRSPRLLAGNGWIGQYLEPMGIQLAFNPNGVVIALIFIGLPFVVRTVQPVLEDAEKELEEAATCLGATRWQTFRLVILPSIAPALLTGFAMAFARALGEYGSVIFIAGNMPMVSEITPLIIIGKLEQYDYAGATAVASVMLLFSFILLLVINALQAWQRRHSGAPA